VEDLVMGWLDVIENVAWFLVGLSIAINVILDIWLKSLREEVTRRRGRGPAEDPDSYMKGR